MKTLIVVPAYNEEANIVKVIHSLQQTNPLWDILIVNDGSRDRTAELAEKTGQAIVIDLPCNLGIGGAVQTGFKYAERNDYDVMVQFDGDGQHRAEEIEKLVAPIGNGVADVVIGSRFCEIRDNFKSTFTRRFGIRIFEHVNSLIIGQKITDNTSGFRAYNRKAIEFLVDFYPMEYPEPETVVLLGLNGFAIKEIFSVMSERQGGRSSIFGMKSFYYMLRVLLGIFMTAIRPKIRKGVKPI